MEAAAKRGGFGDERYERTEFQQKVEENYHLLKDKDWKVGAIYLAYEWKKISLSKFEEFVEDEQNMAKSIPTQ